MILTAQQTEQLRSLILDFISRNELITPMACGDMVDYDTALSYYSQLYVRMLKTQSYRTATPAAVSDICQRFLARNDSLKEMSIEYNCNMMKLVKILLENIGNSSFSKNIYI